MGLKAVHHIHLQSCNLAATLAFAGDFGLIPVAEVSGTHFLRGAGAASYLLAVSGGEESRMVSLAFEVDAVQDLEMAQRMQGATPIRPLPGPDGGCGVMLRDPDGNGIALVHGIASRTPDPMTGVLLLNQAVERPRLGASQRQTVVGPAQLARLGHIGLFTNNLRAMHEWYTQVLGLLPSDVAYAGQRDNLLTGFYRLNRGAEFVDHHVIGLFGLGTPGIHHLSFEVQNLEVQFMLHRWLTARAYESIWGVGRHPKGSHVFDVWRDPAGFRFETFSDTDLLDATHPMGESPIESMEMDMWVQRSHESYFA